MNHPSLSEGKSRPPGPEDEGPTAALLGESASPRRSHRDNQSVLSAAGRYGGAASAKEASPLPELSSLLRPQELRTDCVPDVPDPSPLPTFLCGHFQVPWSL